MNEANQLPPADDGRGLTEGLGPLPEPDYPAGSTGMLGQDCWTRASVITLLAAERERWQAELAWLQGELDASKRWRQEMSAALNECGPNVALSGPLRD